MKWIGYGLQGVGGMMAVTGLGVFALGKLVEHAASRGAAEEEIVELSEAGELAVL
jgi:hypothetical protein